MHHRFLKIKFRRPAGCPQPQSEELKTQWFPCCCWVFIIYFIFFDIPVLFKTQTYLNYIWGHGINKKSNFYFHPSLLLEATPTASIQVQCNWLKREMVSVFVVCCYRNDHRLSGFKKQHMCIMSQLCRLEFKYSEPRFQIHRKLAEYISLQLSDWGPLSLPVVGWGPRGTPRGHPKFLAMWLP